MKSLILLLFVAIAAAGCGSGSETSDAEESESPDSEVATAPSNSTSGVRIQAGEPGIPGSDIPEQFWSLDDGACYRYGQRLVRVTRNGAGESIAVYNGTDRGQCEASSAQAAFSTGTSGDTESFFGVVGDLLLLERATDEEHLIRIVDLGSGSMVHETAYEEPVEINEGGLFYGAPAAEFESQEELNAAGVDCPESGAWFNDSLAVGVSVRSRFDLTARRAELTDDVICIPLI